jgi:tRNA (adenine57-N1/adenine58-N1)-methyltransferase
MIQPGDLVLFYYNDRISYLIAVPEKGKFSTHRGEIDYAQVLASDYGDIVKSHLGASFSLLKPTWSDLTMRVRRTTTIIYPKDAGLMLLKTVITPGGRVIEVGTGSGAFTILLANFVKPDGRVYSYEARSEFSANARTNLRRVGLETYVEFICRDVGKEGFIHDQVDAVFLDVPEPWGLVGYAHKALKGGYPLVSISPTIEQVQKTKSVLELEGFTRIEVVEILEREMLVRVGRTRPKERMVSHTVYLLFAHKINREILTADGGTPPRTVADADAD